MSIDARLAPFYFLRHGKTLANQQGLMCGGKWDIGLCEEGVMQVKQLAGRISGHKWELPSIIYSSPLLRARETAQIIAAYLNLPVHEVEGLREWDLGEWDKRPFEQVRDRFLGTADPKGGETRRRFRARVEAALVHCAAAGKGTVLIVGHGAFGLLVQQLLGIAPCRMENATAYHFKRDAKANWLMGSLFD